MVFNDTTNKNGMIQRFEFWTRQADGAVSGNATLLKIVTAAINSGFDSIMPLLLAFSDNLRWDDLNHTDKPVATIACVSGTSSYKITEDDNSLDILNITNVRIKTGASTTDYVDIERLSIDDPRVLDAISPNTNDSGIPNAFVEINNVLHFTPKFNYSNSTGIKIFFEREQSYFSSSDTTKEPGIPKPFHELPVLYAALDWNMVNRSKDTLFITKIEQKIAKKEAELKRMIALKNPTRNGLRAVVENNK